MDREFNPKLRDWLNHRDYVSGDWPGNLPESVRREADEALGDGYTIDEYGWPMRSEGASCSMSREFKLDEGQEEELRTWMDIVDPPADDPKFIKHGAIGGAFTYVFTPTSLGVVVKVFYCMGSSVEKSIDLTDYAAW